MWVINNQKVNKVLTENEWMVHWQLVIIQWLILCIVLMTEVVFVWLNF